PADLVQLARADARRRRGAHGRERVAHDGARGLQARQIQVGFDRHVQPSYFLVVSAGAGVGAGAGAGSASFCCSIRRFSTSFLSTSLFVTTNSTRRFFAMLRSFVLGAIGLVLPV